VTKLNAAGNGLIFSTILGGERNDAAYGVALDDIGNVYVGGRTNSAKFAVLNPLQANIGLGNSDGFVAKFSPTGQLYYSTYLGGTSTDGVYAIAADSAGNAYVTGDTSSLNLATANAFETKAAGGRDAFVAKLNSSGSAYVYWTYLGGRGSDEGRAIAVDAAGNAYVAGNTFSDNFPVTDGVFQPKLAGNGDGFVANLNDLGTKLLWATYYLGGSGKSAVNEDELVNAIAVDPDGCVYVAGTTVSPDFPVTRAVQPQFGGAKDAFVAKLTSSASNLIFSTFLGGAGNDTGLALVITPLRAVYVAGQTFSADYPVEKALASARGGLSDVSLSAVCDPVLFVNPGSIEFSFTIGGDAPKEQKLNVTACHNLPFSVRVASAGDWLAATPADGILPGTAPISVKPGSLDPGDYTGSVTLSTPDAYFGPVTVPVLLHVFPQPPAI
jgi:hypothetical protein